MQGRFLPRYVALLAAASSVSLLAPSGCAGTDAPAPEIAVIGGDKGGAGGHSGGAKDDGSGGDTTIGVGTTQFPTGAGSGGAPGVTVNEAGAGGMSGGEGGMDAGMAGAPAPACTDGQMMPGAACGNCGTMIAVCVGGVYGAPACTGEGECVAGTTDDKDCGNCGKATRTCDATTCMWGGYGACGSEGECAPGATDESACTGGCDSRACGSDCKWGGCGLKAGAACEWNKGSHYRCCGSQKWQYCLPSCEWSTDCSVCSGCESNCP